MNPSCFTKSVFWMTFSFIAPFLILYSPANCHTPKSSTFRKFLFSNSSFAVSGLQNWMCSTHHVVIVVLQHPSPSRQVFFPQYTNPVSRSTIFYPARVWPVHLHQNLVWSIHRSQTIKLFKWFRMYRFHEKPGFLVGEKIRPDKHSITRK